MSIVLVFKDKFSSYICFSGSLLALLCEHIPFFVINSGNLENQFSTMCNELGNPENQFSTMGTEPGNPENQFSTMGNEPGNPENQFSTMVWSSLSHYEQVSRIQRELKSFPALLGTFYKDYLCCFYSD